MKVELQDREDIPGPGKQYFQSFIDNHPDPTVILNKDGAIQFGSLSFYNITGVKPEEQNSKNITDLIHPEDVAKVIDILKQVLSNDNSTAKMELRFKHRDGSWISVEAAGQNLLNNPLAEGLLVCLRDIRPLKKLEAENRRLDLGFEQRVVERTTQLQAVNKELEAFAYSVSHDLRAPLRSIEGFSQILLEDYAGWLDSQGKDYLQRVRSASQRMAQLIDDILKLSRLTRSEMQREAVDLSALAQTIAGELQRYQPERKVDFIIASGIIARGDSHLLRIAIENLTRNSWKFTKKQPHARIEFGTAEINGKSAYFVRDNGVGFDMAYADNLFRGFQRLHSPAEYEGSGIGLTTVKRIIDRHGGTIWAESAPEQGSTFYFTL